jgi:hypothetical protein
MKEALKLALEALENAIAVRHGKDGTKFVDPLESNAIIAIKEALAQPPLPVQRQQILEAFPLLADEGLDQEKHHCEWALQQDRKRLHAILATPPLPAQPAQEPDELTIAYMSGLYDGKKKRPWVGLTDEEIDNIFWQHENRIEHQVPIYPYERAIEAKLKEKNT